MSSVAATPVTIAQSNIDSATVLNAVCRHIDDEHVREQRQRHRTDQPHVLGLLLSSGGQPLLCDKCNPPTLMKETDIKGIYVCDSGHAKDQRPKKLVPLLPGPLGGARRRRKP
jgi:hypothetical protein